jgi:hypothetical protein
MLSTTRREEKPAMLTKLSKDPTHLPLIAQKPSYSQALLSHNSTTSDRCEGKTWC